MKSDETKIRRHTMERGREESGFSIEDGIGELRRRRFRWIVVLGFDSELEFESERGLVSVVLGVVLVLVHESRNTNVINKRDKKTSSNF